MSARNPLPVLPQEIRFDVNMQLGNREFAALDDNARFIVRRMVGDAFVRGFDHGWIAGQHDAQTDRSIAQDAKTREEA